MTTGTVDRPAPNPSRLVQQQQSVSSTAPKGSSVGPPNRPPPAQVGGYSAPCIAVHEIKFVDFTLAIPLSGNPTNVAISQPTTESNSVSDMGSGGMLDMFAGLSVVSGYFEIFIMFSSYTG